jgi:peptidoglycan/LPS O-acetylase OafA/YrhL
MLPSAKTPAARSAVRLDGIDQTFLHCRQWRFQDTKASVLLDLVRGLAALLVLLQHWRFMLFIPHGPGNPVLWMLFNTLCGAGSMAVWVFFVLSGYLISGSIFRMLEQGRWSWKTYAVHRLTRLWIVLLPGLLLTALLDGIGMHLHRPAAIALYAGLSGNGMVPDVHATSSLGAALGNMFFLQGHPVPSFGSDVVLWSLAAEFWYYVAFALAMISLSGRQPAKTRCVNAGILLCVLLFLPGQVLLYSLIWLAGVALRKLPPLTLSNRLRWTTGIVFTLFFFVHAHSRWLSSHLSNLSTVLATVLLIWVLLSARSRADERTSWVRFSRALARFSYTLYVIHVPILALAAALTLGGSRWVPDAAHLAIGTGILLLTAGFAFIVARVTEFHTEEVRQSVEKLLGRCSERPRQAA